MFSFVTQYNPLLNDFSNVKHRVIVISLKQKSTACNTLQCMAGVIYALYNYFLAEETFTCTANGKYYKIKNDLICDSTKMLFI